MTVWKVLIKNQLSGIQLNVCESSLGTWPKPTITPKGNLQAKDAAQGKGKLPTNTDVIWPKRLSVVIREFHDQSVYQLASFSTLTPTK